MSDVVVPDGSRPGIVRHLVSAVGTTLFVNGVYALFASSTASTAALLGGAVAAAALNVAVVLLVVRSMVEEWLSAATVEDA
jgi:dolichol kinase